MTGVLTLPVIGRPDDILLNSNQRIHRRVRDKRVAYWRELTRANAGNALKAGELVPVERAHIYVWMIWPTLGRRDPNNWHPTAKAMTDGLVLAGVMPDDDWTRVIGPDMRRWPEKGPNAIRIEIIDLGSKA